MPKVGIEPTYPRVHDFESCASACSATSASSQSIHAFQPTSQDFRGESFQKITRLQEAKQCDNPLYRTAQDPSLP